MCNLPGPGTGQAAAGRAPVRYIYIIMPCFEKQGGVPVVDAQTYLYLHPAGEPRAAARARTAGSPYNDDTEQTIVDDFKRLWATNFLDDLAIEVRDVRFANGVIGKVIVYNMEERQRVKIVDYIGSDEGRPVEDRREAAATRASRSGSTRSSIPG